MSGLIMTGDIAANTGRLLPTPYIDKIVLKGEAISDGNVSVIVQGSIFLGDYEDKYFYHNGEVVADEQVYADAASNDVNYYVLICYTGQYHHLYLSDGTDYGAYPQLAETGSAGESLYESIINGDINPFEVYHASGSIYDSGYTPIVLTQVFPMSDEATIYYDESGNELRKYNFEHVYELGTDIDISGFNLADSFIDAELIALGYQTFDHPHPPDVGGGTETGAWNEVKSLKVLTFSSTYDYYSNADTFEEEMTDLAMLDLKTSEISYENVFDEGVLGGKENVVYVDSAEEIYPEIPLVALNITPYKINKITHQQIVDKFQELVDEFKPALEDTTRNRRLKNVTDTIATILSTYAESPNILPQLNQVAKVFPDKAPIKPIGKFYKRFRKRIAMVNRAIMNSSKLRRKTIYSTKISDQRPTPKGAAYTSNEDTGWDDSSGTSTDDTYIYTDWNISRCRNAGYADINFGHFFFDYEKALRRTSNIAKIFDIDKLENYRMPVAWGHFRVANCWVSRQEGSDDGSGTGYSVTNNTSVKIGTTLNSDRPYPRSEYTHVYDAYLNGDTTYYPGVIPDAGDQSYGGGYATYTPYGGVVDEETGDVDGDGYLGAAEGYASSLVYREFLDPSNPTYSNSLYQTSIENYRLMCFELLDYTFTSAGGGGYWTYVHVKDATKDIVTALTWSARANATAIRNYFDTAQELCAYNEDSSEFNQFFRESVAAEYVDDPGSAPWYLGPLVYLLHLDLLYDSFGGDEESLVAAATALSQQIDPINGTLEQLENFSTTFDDFITEAYGETHGAGGGAFGDQIEAMDGPKWMIYYEFLSKDGPAVTYET